MPPSAPLPTPADPLVELTKRLQEALTRVNATKATAEKAQASLDQARSAWEDAVSTARGFHDEFQRAVAAVVPGVKI